MLSIFFGDLEEAYYGPSWFKFNYDPEWFSDKFVQEMMWDVDRSAYRGEELIESDVLGPIPPERLSGGLMTLISIYKRPDLVFDATSFGENCAKWLLETGRKEDVTVELNYLMRFPARKDFKIKIANTGIQINSLREYISAALDLLS